MNWLHRIFNKRLLEREMDAELASHIEHHIRENMDAGMSEAEAERRARLEFGGIDAIKEECREARGVAGAENLLRDVRHAIRSLWRSPAFSMTVILSLAVAIGANAAVFGVVNAILVKSLPYREPDRLVTFDFYDRTGTYVSSGVDTGLLWDLKQSGIFEDVAVTIGNEMNWTGGSEPEQLAGASLSHNFFQVLGTEASIGRTFGEADVKAAGDHLVVLSHTLWRRRFGGDAEIIGKPVLIDGQSYVVTGVVSHDFVFPDGKADFFLPGPWAALPTGGHGTGAAPAFARIRGELSLEQAQSFADVLSKRVESLHPELSDGLGIRIVPLAERVTGEYASSLKFLQAGVLVVLLIACVNISSLFVSRSTLRRGELLIRASLGASRGRLIQHMLVESFLVAIAGAVLAVALAWWVLQIVPSFIAYLPRANEIGLDRSVLVFTALTSIGCALLCGLIPAFDSSGRLLETMGDKSFALSGSRRQRLRSLMVAFQVAGAMLLVVVAGLALNSMARLHQVNPGFEPHGILTAQIRVPYAQYRTDMQGKAVFFREVVKAVREIPGVSSASGVTDMPFDGTRNGPVSVASGATAQQALLRTIEPEFFHTLQIVMPAGREFTSDDRKGAPPVAVVNKTLARRLWGDAQPLGQDIEVSVGSSKDWFTVVGLVEDVVDTPYRPAFAEVYLPLQQSFERGNNFFLTVRTSAPLSGLAESIRNRVWTLAKDQPVTDVITYDERIGRSRSDTTFRVAFQSAFALIGLALASVGIYGTLSYVVSTRRRDIAVRTALGARPAELIGMILRQALVPVAAGMAIALGGFITIVKFAPLRLPLVLFKIEADDTLTYAVVGIFMFSVAVFAAYLPARRAARIDPMQVLRQD